MYLIYRNEQRVKFTEWTIGSPESKKDRNNGRLSEKAHENLL